MNYIAKNLFSLSIVGLMIITLFASYYRFLVLEDHIVAFETDCDPANTSCFVGCEDEDCESTYLYSRVIAPAPLVNDWCGSDVNDCDVISYCTNTDDCEILICNSENGDECNSTADVESSMGEDYPSEVTEVQI